jgi:hypothetical protein
MYILMDPPLWGAEMKPAYTYPWYRAPRGIPSFSMFVTCIHVFRMHNFNKDLEILLTFNIKIWVFRIHQCLNTLNTEFISNYLSELIP